VRERGGEREGERGRGRGRGRERDTHTCTYVTDPLDVKMVASDPID